MYINIKFAGSDVCFYGEGLPDINQGLYFEHWFNIKSFSMYRNSQDPLDPMFFLRNRVSSSVYQQKSFNSLQFYFNEFMFYTGESAYAELVKILNNRLVFLVESRPNI